MFDHWLELEISHPIWLAGLIVLPFLAVYFHRSLVDLPRRQMIASLLLRSLIVTLLFLCLSGWHRLTTSRDVFVVFAIDESRSVDAQAQSVAAAFVAAATAGVDRDRFDILQFATSARKRWAVTGSESKKVETPPDDEDLWRNDTCIDDAIASARSIVPPQYVPHVVVISDGNETHGDAVAEAMSAKSRVSAVPLPTRGDPECQLTALNLPSQVAQREPFPVEVVIDSNHAETVLLEIFSGDHKVISEIRTIKIGENRLTFTQQVEGPTEYTAMIRRPNGASGAEFSDTFVDNNSATGLVFAAGRPRVLLIDSNPDTTDNFQWAMEAEGIDIDVRPPEGLPRTLAEMQNYQVLILSNVAATNLSTDQMIMIRSFVSDMGAGFIMLGGDQSFGLGGYYRTVIDDILPVRSDFKKEQEKPGLGMVLVIDRSGSMGGPKIELAKDAAKAAVELLGSKDQIGVIAFQSTPAWISELRPLAQKSVVLDRIAAIQAGGGTTLYPAMEMAFQALQTASAKLKHVIVLTDGYSTPADFESLTREMAAARITVSTVGIGDTDQPLLERIADLGSGRSYFTRDANSIPQIFAKETIEASKSAINEDPFVPMVVRATPVLAGIDMETAPFLYGYVVTRPKATSEIILTTSETGDPLLAWWRYGLGTTAAFSSDVQSRWAEEWLAWDGFSPFWAQVIRHCMKKQESSGIVVDIRQSAGTAEVIIDAVDHDGAYINDATTDVTILSPGSKTQSVPALQVAPGRYVGSIPVPQGQTSYVQITQQRNGTLLHQETRGLVSGYSEELRLRDTNERLLREVAEATGGLFAPRPEAVFDPQPFDTVKTAKPLWPFFMTIAAILFLFDVALRRIDLTFVFGDDDSSDR